MKSICIKTNNLSTINYLLKSLENINIHDTYLSVCNFKHFKNIIFHYTNTQNIDFITSISNLISKAIIEIYEKDIIYENITLNYFYFNSKEKHIILDNTINALSEKELYTFRYNLINNSIYNFLTQNHSLYLQGFINFKLSDYMNFINSQIDIAVNKFLIDKEYFEFVNILRLYIKSEEYNSKLDHLHLIYQDKNGILIDDEKNIINYNDISQKTKYISDISFSTNDLVLNTLLNLIPKKITIHLIDKYPDEFINTLKLIFQDKIKICEECDICNIYKIQKIKRQ